MLSSAPRPASPDALFAPDAALLQRYDGAGPRYTSYPPATAFTDHFGPDQLTQALSRSNAPGRALSLYVHIPFCRRICFYCGCNRIATRQTAMAEPYLERLTREMALMRRHLDGDRMVEQLHWGGGTPTFLNLDQMSRLIDTLGAHFTLSDRPDRDFAIEIDPREANVYTLRHLQSLGFNRLSLGVQDLNLRVQKAINRVQPRELSENLIDEARRLGFRSLNLDLIYGLPHQSVASFADTLDQIIDMAPARLSIFNYAHLPERFLPQRRINSADLPDTATRLAIQCMTVTKLTQAGYVHIGMDHFARPDDSLAVAQREGQLQRNFQGYTTHAHCDLIGLGVSAISQVDDTYAQNAAQLEAWQGAIDSGQLATCRGVRLSADDRLRRHVIHRLMCDMRLDIDAIEATFGINVSYYFENVFEKLATFRRDGLIEYDKHSLMVTPMGRLLIRQLAMAFDTRLTAEGRQRFSRIL
ncbi:oxygen-independent coproporphyrinogen III oxidase [Kushneria pakistanensis]|uniref:Coproporphyrinogen-III oxidase n=1 Tax=Kushneria pakistanensis TaxID=1508770 RepID=A0ABQ3FI18_9GAMM|nr:oxygen-independent coproporphyrinogen III oxidase [Kushneria pakistanensis]GHC24934.1 oxygen-independent coproporphyrinogen III oxidase [Kushneria pakistanensis]